LLTQPVRRAFSRAAAGAGSSKAAGTATIAITANNSMSANPRYD